MGTKSENERNLGLVSHCPKISKGSLFWEHHLAMHVDWVDLRQFATIRSFTLLTPGYPLGGEYLDEASNWAFGEKFAQLCYSPTPSLMTKDPCSMKNENAGTFGQGVSPNRFPLSVFTQSFNQCSTIRQAQASTFRASSMATAANAHDAGGRIKSFNVITVT
eukprot:1526935-Rhodomonas_salina.1